MKKKVKCEYFKEYPNTPEMPYDCERDYDKNGRKDTRDIYHFDTINHCLICCRNKSKI
jgi:hypothetical protein